MAGGHSCLHFHLAVYRTIALGGCSRIACWLIPAPSWRSFFWCWS
ncbi:hypothetical protein Ae706Ps2_6568 [Pseudonocardia sp. Ae706_Ps2]|nr:hypothetical protein Ae706Ps2_6562 [Pseudonocardia sp. Ae706_Ps2]OLM08868.1 hypothetical protein Ae706Ps2_6568 [Pseudonocardia sp. Ae706_Ps2]